MLWKCKKKGTVFQSSAKKELLMQIGVENNQDDKLIHPQQICNACNTKLSHRIFFRVLMYCTHRLKLYSM